MALAGFDDHAPLTGIHQLARDNTVKEAVAQAVQNDIV
jgi:hypothetical protein